MYGLPEAWMRDTYMRLANSPTAGIVVYLIEKSALGPIDNADGMDYKQGRESTAYQGPGGLP
jgi:hypothetical protein